MKTFKEFACFRVYIPNWVTLQISVLSPHKIKINHQQQQQQQKPQQFFAHPKQNSWGILLHIAAVCLLNSPLFSTGRFGLDRSHWMVYHPSAFGSYEPGTINGSQIAHGNGFPYYFRGLNVNTTVATMGTNVLFILGAITHMFTTFIVYWFWGPKVGGAFKELLYLPRRLTRIFFRRVEALGDS